MNVMGKIIIPRKAGNADCLVGNSAKPTLDDPREAGNADCPVGSCAKPTLGDPG